MAVASEIVVSQNRRMNLQTKSNDQKQSLLGEASPGTGVARVQEQPASSLPFHVAAAIVQPPS